MFWMQIGIDIGKLRGILHILYAVYCWKPPCQIARSTLLSPMGSSMQTHQWDDLQVVLRRPKPRCAEPVQWLPFILETTPTPRSQSQMPINSQNLMPLPQVRFFLGLTRTSRLACFQVQTHRRGGASGLRERWNHQASKGMTNITTGRVVGRALPSGIAFTIKIKKYTINFHKVPQVTLISYMIGICMFVERHSCLSASTNQITGWSTLKW